MTNDELETFARDKARQTVEALAEAVGVQTAAEITIRVALECLLEVDQPVVAAIFRGWANDCENTFEVH